MRLLASVTPGPAMRARKVILPAASMTGLLKSNGT